MLQIADLTYRIAGRVLFDKASVAIPTGQRVGLVGRNGTGKSTLLKLIAGDLHPDGGEITLPSRARIGTVAQHTPEGPDSLLATVMAADKELAALTAEAEAIENGRGDPHKLAEIHSRLADIEAHTAEARAATILSGLGFDAAAQRRGVGELSGGWRMRVALAAALFTRPDLLLLDEPTNHLDLEAAMWLEGYLRGYPYSMIVVSHDRDMLNRVVQKTVHLENGKLTLYNGGYDTFERTRAERLEHQKALADKQEAQRKHLMSFVDRFRYKASKARQAQSRLKMIERMQPIISIAEEATPNLAFPNPGDLAPPILTLDQVTVGYDDKPVLRGLNLRLDMDDRIALLGQNGNGKSTLVKLLGGRLGAMDGTLYRAGRLRVGYFAQHQTDELDLKASGLQLMMRALPDATETQARSQLGRFGFPQQKADTLVGSMSGGEKARLLLALMSRDKPHLLLLDEPTNHLDVDSREALVQALNAFEGAVVLISHDAHLVSLTADRLWLVAAGTCRPFDGDLEDYKALLAEQRRAAARGETYDPHAFQPKSAAVAEPVEGPASERAVEAQKPGKDLPGAGKDKRRAAAEMRAQLAPLRRRVRKAEETMAKLQSEKGKIEALLGDPGFYDKPGDEQARVQRDLGFIAKDLADAEEEWLAAQEELESAEQAA